MNSDINAADSFEWQYIIKHNKYTIYQSGSHIHGNFIQVLVPEPSCYTEHKKRKLVTYLHGFALCLPKFYEAHLEKLAEQGYFVFFPDFQNSDYPDRPDQHQLIPSQDKRHLYFWYQMVIDAITQKKTSSADKFVKQKRKAEEFYRIRKDPNEPSALKCLLVALALVVIIIIVKLIYLFDAKFSKNLVKLISTVGLSLLYSPEVWMKRSINLTIQAWQKLCQDDPKLAEEDFEFYVFGHSLGGLLALSWTAYQGEGDFLPKQVVVADPAPSTEMGIPKIALIILKLFGSPFTSSPITIQETGSQLSIPVGILHGAADNIVRPQAWVQTSRWQQKSNFDFISSSRKKIYFSLSAPENKPPLTAFHNQAVTDTTYFDAALFNNFGGVKSKPDAYNHEYIWPGLHLVLKDKVEADDLLGKFPLNTIDVTDVLPHDAPQLTWLLPVIGLVVLGLLYGFWHFGLIV